MQAQVRAEALSKTYRVGFFARRVRAVEDLSFAGRLCGLSRADARKRTVELLERVGLAGRADRPIRKFSKGMVQRLALAQALVGDPRIAILDEPMSGLDPIGRKDVRDLI